MNAAIKFKLNCLLIIFLLLSSSLASATESGVNFSIKILGGGYTGKNTTSETEFNSGEGGQLVMNMAYQYGKFYTGLNIQGGVYSFDKQAPDQVTPSVTSSVSNDKVTHAEVDLVFGYYLIDQLSVFIDLKTVSDTWESNQHAQEFSGAGLGLAGYWPINNKWIVYGSFGGVSSGELKYSGEKFGEGKSQSLDIGALYKLTTNHRLTFGVKRTRYVYEYDSGDEQRYIIGGGYIGYNYAFGL